MLKSLTLEQSAWVEQTLASMSVEECVGHLICPEQRKYKPEDWAAIMEDVPLGSVFFGRMDPGELRECLDAVQSGARIPVLVASDLEHGAGCMVEGCLDFPWPMACGAANSPEMMLEMGRATAREGREHGIHWTFSPVADLNYNFQNPVTNIRSLGDDPELVARLIVPLIIGLQEGGLLAATAKHFPGDGMDDRDQHLCTSVNSMDMDEWRAAYGKVWRATIDAGVMSIMSGHISLPAYEGMSAHPSTALPATLSRQLQVNLLRDELGFDGVIVSDAAPMIGLTSRVHSTEVAVQNILAGSDVFLFAEPREDYQLLLNAVKKGRITEERLKESARRMLEMKARLGLHTDVRGAEVAEGEKDGFQKVAASLARKSITVLRKDRNVPVSLKGGAKVLNVIINHEKARSHLSSDLPVVTEELRKRGFKVDELHNPSHSDIIEKAPEYDHVFVNLVITPHALVGTVRMVGSTIMPFWRSFWVDYPHVTITSFGSPYHLYELPHLPNMVLAYGPSLDSQRAAVAAWLGEYEPKGECPVKMPKF